MLSAISSVLCNVEKSFILIILVGVRDAQISRFCSIFACILPVSALCCVLLGFPINGNSHVTVYHSSLCFACALHKQCRSDFG